VKLGAFISKNNVGRVNFDAAVQKSKPLSPPISHRRPDLRQNAAETASKLSFFAEKSEASLINFPKHYKVENTRMCPKG